MTMNVILIRSVDQHSSIRGFILYDRLDFEHYFVIMPSRDLSSTSVDIDFIANLAIRWCLFVFCTLYPIVKSLLTSIASSFQF